MGTKPLRIRFNKIDGFIKIYVEIRYLILYDYKRYNAIYDRIKYLISEKSGIIDSNNNNFSRIRIDSCNSLTLIKSTVNKNKNEYYYNILLEKVPHKDKFNTQYF